MKKVGVIFIAAIVVLTVIIGGLSYLYLYSGQTGYEGTPDGNDVDPNAGLTLAPDFTLPKVGGGTASLLDYHGKVVVLDFMATWCNPCIIEIGHLKEIDQAYGNDVVIISIDVDDTEGEALLSPFTAEHGMTWPVLMDTSGISQASGYSASSIPTLVVVNKDGYIQHRAVGVTPASDLMDIIDPIL